VHIDHVGRIPHLLAAGFDGAIYCSEPSAVLLPLVLEDAIKVGFTRDKRLVERFLSIIKQRIVAVPYGQWLSVKGMSFTKNKDQTQVKFKPAGHILGSAYVEVRTSCQSKPQRKLESNDAKTKHWHKTIFSGDLGAPYSPLLNAPKAPYSADVVVLESTYGHKKHESRRSRRDRLRKALLRALKDNGTVLIPAFSIGRTQELLYELEHIIHRERSVDENERHTSLEQLQVVIDSPLAARFTEVYKQLEPFWDKEAKNKRTNGRHPLSFNTLTTIDSHQDHLKTVRVLAETEYPAVVIAASGMCAGGRIVNYLKAMIDNPVHDILFVGYQAEGTLGRDILSAKQGDNLWVDGERKQLRAQVNVINGYSAHADQKDLINFVKRMRKPPELVKLVHGSEHAKRTLADKITQLGIECEIGK
jgi:metallo-beta-lactamase family protein